MEVEERRLGDIITNATQINDARTAVTFMIDYYIKTVFGIILPLVKGKP